MSLRELTDALTALLFYFSFYFLSCWLVAMAVLKVDDSKPYRAGEEKAIENVQGSTSFLNRHVSTWIHVQNTFGILITVKSSLTYGFFQKFASTHHSSFMMAVCRLCNGKCLENWTFRNCQLTRFELICLLIEQSTAKYWHRNENLSPLPHLGI